jgi:hypothetical protein
MRDCFEKVFSQKAVCQKFFWKIVDKGKNRGYNPDGFHPTGWTKQGKRKGEQRQWARKRQ